MGSPSFMTLERVKTFAAQEATHPVTIFGADVFLHFPYDYNANYRVYKGAVSMAPVCVTNDFVQALEAVAIAVQKEPSNV